MSQVGVLTVVKRDRREREERMEGIEKEGYKIDFLDSPSRSVSPPTLQDPTEIMS